MPKKEQRKVYSGSRKNRDNWHKDAEISDLSARINKQRKNIMNNAEIYGLLTYYKYLSDEMSVMLEGKLNSPEVKKVQKEISELKIIRSDNVSFKKKIKTLEKDNIELNDKILILDENLDELNKIISENENKFQVIKAIDDSVWKIFQEKNGSWTVKFKDERTSNSKTILEALIG